MAQALRITQEIRAREDRPVRQEKKRIGVAAAVPDSTGRPGAIAVVYWGRDKMRRDDPAAKQVKRPLSNYAKQLHNEHFKGWGIDLQPHREVRIPAAAIKTRLPGTCSICAAKAATVEKTTTDGSRLGFCSGCWDDINGGNTNG